MCGSVVQTLLFVYCTLARGHVTDWTASWFGTLVGSGMAQLIVGANAVH